MLKYVPLSLARTTAQCDFAESIEIREVVRREMNAGRGDILFQVFDLRRSRNGQHDGTAPQDPRQRDLAACDAVSLRDLSQY